MKVSWWVIILLGFCIGVSALAFVFLQVYAPYEKAADYYNTYHQQLEVEANKQGRAEERVRKAMKTVNDAAAQWNSIVAAKTPPDSLAAGGVNVSVNPYQLVVDSVKYRNSVQREFNRQIHAGGVKVVAAPQIPMPTDNEKEILPSFYGYPTLAPFPVVLFELGSVTVSGNYKQIMANVRSWTKMPRYLAVVDGLRIDGTSPNLTASYNVTILGYIRAKTMFPAHVEPAGAAGAGGTTPGGGPATPGGPAGGPPRKGGKAG